MDIQICKNKIKSKKGVNTDYKYNCFSNRIPKHTVIKVNVNTKIYSNYLRHVVSVLNTMMQSCKWNMFLLYFMVISLVIDVGKHDAPPNIKPA